MAGNGNWTPITWTQANSTVTFQEEGLPTGTDWSISVNGSAMSSTSGVLRVALPNGTYSYSVAGVPGYQTNSYAGTVDVTGHSLTIYVNWTRVVYPLSFNESGLPAGTSWGVWVYGAWRYSTIPSISLSVPNGTFNYTVEGVPGWRTTAYTGSVDVANGSASVEIDWMITVYTVEFTETGLPIPWEWSVALNGVTNDSGTSTVGFLVANGSGYAYSIAPANGYSPTDADGLLTVAGAEVFEAVTFAPTSPAESALWFNETGLPAGSNWSAELTATGSFSGTESNYSHGPSIGFRVPVGLTATYAVSSIPTYHATPASGALADPVDGAPLTEAIVFSVTNGQGPPSPPSISSFTADPVALTLGQVVTLQVVVKNGSAPLSYVYAGLPSPCESTNASTLTCTPESSGSFTIRVNVTDTLHRTAEANATFTVSGAGSTQPPTGDSGNSSPTLFGLPAGEGYALVAATVIVLVLVIGFVIWRDRRGRPPAGESEPVDSAPEALEPVDNPPGASEP